MYNVCATNSAQHEHTAHYQCLKTWQCNFLIIHILENVTQDNYSNGAVTYSNAA